MRARIVLLLIAVCGVIAFGAWLWSSRENSRAEVRQAEAPSSTEENPSALPITSTKPSDISDDPAQPGVSEMRAAAEGTQPANAGPNIPGASGSLPPSDGSAQTGGASSLPAGRSAAPAAPVSVEQVASDVDRITFSLRDYRTVLGENPVGTNAEITKALNGGNSRQATLLPPGQSLNGKGEMVDRFGTPYFFHQLSRNQMEIRSAGVDKVLWTDDDTVSN